ncbi:GNAT family N-acetyltransferase [Paenibacillus tritici]|uniref:GNAT family N-acetyltransferase n=1 Tax=Paenibacillus tritici TaxID=1873425 RepID=UPI001BA56616|nr:GNAT family N-acetyltransferase [Paenibacillus tritici]QUL52765.1 GNAT family N-acetyltransferase [Paenibacillus tritici]
MQKLDNQDYALALPLLSEVKINTLFAGGVLGGQTTGKVYVDSVQNPRTFYVAHDFGMSLLYGDSGNEDFNRSLSDYMTNKKGNRHSVEWLQADPAGGWEQLLESTVTEHNALLSKADPNLQASDKRRIDIQTRVNFTFDQEVYHRAKKQGFRQDAVIVQMTGEGFDEQAGSVIPRYFWRNAEHFRNSGMGYTLLWEGEKASSAFSAYRTADQLEIGIESAAGHRGKGFAFSVCCALIDYCLEHGLEPVWGCRLENKGSYQLAQKLGFKPSLNIPYYRLAE